MGIDLLVPLLGPSCHQAPPISPVYWGVRLESVRGGGGVPTGQEPMTWRRLEEEGTLRNGGRRGHESGLH